MIHAPERSAANVHLIDHAPTRARGEGADRVIAHLGQKGRRFEILNHPPATTALDEAGELHAYADSVIKALLVHSDGQDVALVAVPASRRVDMNLLRDALADPAARLATEREIVELFPWVELGALPALGSLLELPMVVEIELLSQDEVIFAAASRTCSIKMQTDDYLEGEPFSIAPLVMHHWWDEVPI